jgi:predicted TIM-barrel fold metal-dependent hydrolase
MAELRALAARLPAADRAKLMGENAAAAYRL